MKKRRLIKKIIAAVFAITIISLNISFNFNALFDNKLNNRNILQFGNNVYASSVVVTLAANMPAPRHGHAQSTLKDGRVLVTGGRDVKNGGSSNTLTTSWIYDPSTNTWTVVANMPAPRHDHTQSTLSDGRVLVTGGFYSGTRYNTAWIYNPSTNTWSSAANMPSGRTGHAQSTLNDGCVLVTGGENNSTYYKTAWKYNPSTNTWTSVADMPKTRYSHAQSTLTDGRVLVTGGSPSVVDTTWIYNPSTNIWTNVEELNRHGHAQSTLTDGRVLVTGGSVSSYSKEALIYDPSDNTWTNTIDMPFEGFENAQSTLNDGRVLVTGGSNSSGITKQTCIYYFNSPATVSISYPTEGNIFCETDVLLPRISISDANINTHTCKYYVDSESTPRDIKIESTASTTKTVTFSGLNISTLTDGNHTLRFEVNDGYDTSTATVNIKVDKSAPTLGTITTTSDINSITVTGSATDSISGLSTTPYRYTIGTGSPTAWITNTSYTKTGLIPNTLYAVKFEAQDKKAHIVVSNQSIYTKAQVPTITVGNPSSYTLDLSAADNNPTSTQYQIIVNNTSLYVTPEGTLTSSPIWLTLPTKSITVSGLSPSTTYSFKMKAKNSASPAVETALSNQVSGTTLVAPPGSPTNIVATATNNSITVSWNAVTGALRYDIKVDGSIINNNTNISYYHSGLSPNTPHTYRVRAINQGGPGNWSAPITKSTVPNLPTPPLNINAAATDTKVIVTWNAVPGVSGYDIEVDSQVINNGSSTNYVHAGLSVGTTHSYRVRSINSGGKSPWSNEVLVTTQINTPTIPVNIQTVAGKTEINITWNAVTGATGYDVEVDGFIADAGNRTSYTHSGLLPGTQHTYRVRSKKSGLESDWSSQITVITLDDIFGTPIDVKLKATNNSISLNWSAVANATGFDVEADGVIIDNGTFTSCIFVGILPNTAHSYRVRARNGSELSDWTPIFEINTYALPAPTDISATSTENSITSTWGSVAGANSYEIEIDGFIIGNTTQNNYTIENLNPGNQYYLKVRAVNNEGISAWSESSAVTTVISGNSPATGMFAMVRETSVRVIWPVTEGATSYDLDVDGTIITGLTETSYLHEGLTPGTQHNYKLRAVKGIDVGIWSGSLPASTLTIGPASPGNITASTTISSVLITWDNVQNATGYDIEVDGQIIDAGQTASYYHNGLSPNTQHTYKVRSRNNLETSPWSQTIDAITSNAVQNIVLDCSADDVFNLILTAANLPVSGQFTFTITYDAEQLELMDLCGTTPRIDMAVGGIIGTDLQVVQLEPGIIVITKNCSSQGQGWSGVLNTVKFKSKINGQATVSYSLN